MKDSVFYVIGALFLAVIGLFKESGFFDGFNPSDVIYVGSFILFVMWVVNMDKKEKSK